LFKHFNKIFNATCCKKPPHHLGQNKQIIQRFRLTASLLSTPVLQREANYSKASLKLAIGFRKMFYLIHAQSKKPALTRAFLTMIASMF